MTNSTEASANITTDEVSKFVDTHRTNVKSDLIEITEDKLENILLKHLSNVSIKRSWAVPLSIFLSLLLANLTADFTLKFQIPGHFWQALFVLSCLGSGIWLVITIVKIVFKYNKTTIEGLISQIKNAPKK